MNKNHIEVIADQRLRFSNSSQVSDGGITVACAEKDGSNSPASRRFTASLKKLHEAESLSCFRKHSFSANETRQEEIRDEMRQ